jgi:hypothetical protein
LELYTQPRREGWDGSLGEGRLFRNASCCDVSVEFDIIRKKRLRKFILDLANRIFWLVWLEGPGVSKE